MSKRAFSRFTAGFLGPAWSSRRVALTSCLGAWGLYLAFIVFRLTANRFRHELLLIPWQCLGTLAGIAMTWLLYLPIRRLDGASIATRVIVASALALPAAGLLAIINHTILFDLAPSRIWRPEFVRAMTLRKSFTQTIGDLYFAFISWSALYLSVTAALASQEAERRAAVAQTDVRESELRALRYQLNPHFLFNALNTVSALVLRGDSDGAENTIQALSLFLRSALGNDSLEDTTLAKELDVQRRYLEIEHARYGDRLAVRLAIPAELEGALIPPRFCYSLLSRMSSITPWHIRGHRSP